SPVARGKKDGALADVHAVDLSAHIMKAAIDKAGVDPASIDDAFWGCAMPEIVLAGGVEMMSQVPMSGYHTRLDPDLTESYIGMGFTAERMAQRWNVTREDQDRWALGSQQKAAKALASGAFDSQIMPVPVESVVWNGSEKSATTADFARDELPRPDTTIEG